MTEPPENQKEKFKNSERNKNPQFLTKRLQNVRNQEKQRDKKISTKKEK